MTNKYNQIQRLIGFWQQYEESVIKPEFIEFSNWLGDYLKKGNEHAEGKNGTGVQRQFVIDDTGAFALKQQVNDLISRLSRLLEFYTKKFFEGLPINSLLEFNFLFSINKNISLKKKEIIGLHLVEYSTGIDILKRLIKQQLLTETRDELDKRSKRLKITPEGKRVLMEALIRMNKINHLFFTKLDENTLNQLLPALNKLDNHHKKVFTKYGSNPDFKILQILESIDEVM